MISSTGEFQPGNTPGGKGAGLVWHARRFFTFERALLLILVLAFFLRVYQLDLKLLHQDEATHAWYCYRLLTLGTWQYDPSFHGPFLYYATAAVFSLAGPSDFAARILPSLFGFALIPLVYCIYRMGYLSEGQALIVSLFLAISPDMVYFSRFLRHDIFMLFFTLLFVVALFAYFGRGGRTVHAATAAVAAGLALCCKEEMPVILLIILSFFAIQVWQKRLVLPQGWKKDGLVFVLVTAGLMAVLYSAFFSHPETLVGTDFAIGTTGWYQAVAHWSEMHSMQRLGGPVYYYLLLGLLYELPVVILAAIGTAQFVFSGDSAAGLVAKLKSRLFGASAGAAGVAAPGHDAGVTEDRPELFFRFCIYWMLLTMAFYAIMGEKVPWLLIHQLLPMCFVAVYRLNRQKAVFAVAGCVFLAAMTMHVAFVPADINEPIVQVQPSEDLREVMHGIDASDSVLLGSRDFWLLHWYYRGDRYDKINSYGDFSNKQALTTNQPDMIILDETDSAPSLDGYEKKTYRLNYWFSYDDNRDRLLHYYIFRDGKTGGADIDVFTRLKAAG